MSFSSADPHHLQVFATFFFVFGCEPEQLCKLWRGECWDEKVESWLNGPLTSLREVFKVQLTTGYISQRAGYWSVQSLGIDFGPDLRRLSTWIKSSSSRCTDGLIQSSLSLLMMDVCYFFTSYSLLPTCHARSDISPLSSGYYTCDVTWLSACTLVSVLYNILQCN